MAKETDFDDWITQGITKGWISPPFCNTHEGDPYMSPEEEDEWESGGDPCLYVVKLLA